MDLPVAKYHPDPVATGSVRAGESTPCLCCNRIRGYIYTGPAFSERFHYLSGAIEDDLPEAVLVELATRTPGFDALQQETWLTHCGDAAAYTGGTSFRCLHCGATLSYEDLD